MIAFVLVAIALLSMGIGYFSGRNKILKKQCGTNPNKEKDEACGKNPNCELCGDPEAKPEEKKR